MDLNNSTCFHATDLIGNDVLLLSGFILDSHVPRDLDAGIKVALTISNTSCTQCEMEEEGITINNGTKRIYLSDTIIRTNISDNYRVSQASKYSHSICVHDWNFLCHYKSYFCFSELLLQYVHDWKMLMPLFPWQQNKAWRLSIVLVRLWSYHSLFLLDHEVTCLKTASVSSWPPHTYPPSSITSYSMSGRLFTTCTTAKMVSWYMYFVRWYVPTTSS